MPGRELFRFVGVDGCEDCSSKMGAKLVVDTAESDDMACCMPEGLVCGDVPVESRDCVRNKGADSFGSPISLEADIVGILNVGTPESAKAVLKLTRDDLRVDLLLSLSRRLRCPGTCGVPASCSARLIVSSTSSSSERISSSSSCGGLPLVIKNTPKKVRRQPPMNLRACSVVVCSKSRYKTALPIMTHNVKDTNCIGMTCVESNLCRALFTYRTCMTAVPSRMKMRTYVTGVLKAPSSVDDNMEETPLVAKAVYPPAILSQHCVFSDSTLRLTEQTNKTEVDQYGAMSVSGAQKHQNDDEKASDSYVYLESCSRNRVPHIVRVQFGFLRICT